MDFLKEWMGLLGAVMATGAMFYSWLTSNSKHNSDKIELIEKEVIGQKLLISQIESELAHLPDKDTVTDLKIEITRLAGVIGQLGEKVQNQGRTLRDMDQFLRSEK